ncbi:monocarboxylate transporter 12-like [Mya arenaria]|uniref:monocarboxylate transporter 12-like n=1 Tax=Mya arenaria TaxID=6604 RepID=UPI0022E867AF|nr:monocarboxylate transporter 12-like [Mya arenaria]
MVPQDSGWSWMVLIGAALQLMLTLGISKSSGILFVAFQDRFDSSAATTSLLSTVQNLTYGVSAMFVMTVGVKLTTCRNLVFVGSLLNSAGFIITSRAVSINVLLFSYGVLIGLGYALTIGTSIIMVGLYFDKRRGLATTLAIAGGSVGLDTFQQVLGFTESSQCVTAACEFYIVGYLHDVTGNWVVPFHFLGSSVMLGGIIMFFLPKLKTE